MLAPSSDLSGTLAAVAVGVCALSLLLLVVEVRTRASGRLAILGSGLLAATLSLAAVLRPVRVSGESTRVGPKVVVLADRSRRQLLPGAKTTREATLREAAKALGDRGKDARISVLGFVDGETAPLDDELPSGTRSDLDVALRRVLEEQGEAPQLVVVLTDGRVELREDVVTDLVQRKIPVAFVPTAEEAPKDVSVRRVEVAGAAIAHQPFSLALEIGCHDLPCDGLPVTVRELIDGGEPVELGRGKADASSGTAKLELPITLERAGGRLLEVAVVAPSGDAVPANDRRLFEVHVARERVRVLHVAGHPTYDVRALRTWLKSNASVDVVAFFILRSHGSRSKASDNELALIRFPVDELFTEHLPSFDAVVLQDIDAEEYQLRKYFQNITAYVRKGGGLVMVGGPTSFTEGNYVSSSPKDDLSQVLPVALPEKGVQPAIDTATFVPRITELGRAAPVLSGVRSLFPGELPEMPGTNVVGDARPGALVLWEHPTRKTATQKPMPVLTLGDVGDGRAIALTVDGVHKLGFSEQAAALAGRGHGALWDGLLGWLMRDPRFEPAEVDLVKPCIEGRPAVLRVRPLPGITGKVVVELGRSGAKGASRTLTAEIPDGGGPVDLALGNLEAGGYFAKVQVGAATKTRRAFACEKGGEAWADSRPDVALLRRVAQTTGGVVAPTVDRLPFPPAKEVHKSRREAPLAPPWAWALGAALALGGHWIVRRRTGLA